MLSHQCYPVIITLCGSSKSASGLIYIQVTDRFTSKPDRKHLTSQILVKLCCHWIKMTQGQYIFTLTTLISFDRIWNTPFFNFLDLLRSRYGWQIKAIQQNIIPNLSQKFNAHTKHSLGLALLFFLKDQLVC